MDVDLLSRVQFAFTIMVHYVFPPLSIGLGVLLVAMEATYLRTGDPMHEQMTKFWVRIFGLIFAIGVATGIVMEFQFGTNWSTYSRFVGDVFGSPLAAEGIFAFFLESGFLALLLFGWGRVKPAMHFFATVMVALGSHFSAVWIVVANSWQQTPAGHHIVGEGIHARAEIVDFWAVVFNPSSVDRLTHTIMGCWQAGAWLVLSVSAYYLLRGRHEEIAKKSMQLALVLALVSSLGQLATGHTSAEGVASNQPAKLAAFEGHYPESAPADLYLLGWVDEPNEKVLGIAIPGMLSMMVHGDPKAPVTGLRAFPPEDRPPVQIVFQTYHAMVGIGMVLIGLAAAGIALLRGGRLFRMRWLLWAFVGAVLLPQFANQLGWMSAEIGRQPWIVYGLLRRVDGLSRVVSAGQVLWSIIMFGLIYALLMAAFVFLLDKKIKHGPVEDAEAGKSDKGLAEGRRA
jgi:cytochrome d ubiquinol oxidase subunit I